MSLIPTGSYNPEIPTEKKGGAVPEGMLQSNADFCHAKDTQLNLKKTDIYSCSCKEQFAA